MRMVIQSILPIIILTWYQSSAQTLPLHSFEPSSIIRSLVQVIAPGQLFVLQQSFTCWVSIARSGNILLAPRPISSLCIISAALIYHSHHDVAESATMTKDANKSKYSRTRPSSPYYLPSNVLLDY